MTLKGSNEITITSKITTAISRRNFLYTTPISVDADHAMDK